LKVLALRALSVYCLLLVASASSGQQRTMSLSLQRSDSVIALADNFPDFSTLRLQIDSSFYLQTPNDYRIDSAERRVILSPALRALLFPQDATSSAVHKLIVSYHALPISLPRVFSRHEVDRTVLDSLSKDSTSKSLAHITSRASETERADLFSNFQKSGSISRGFQVGSNRDLGLTSGFNLQFSGDIAKDVNITGALTEEQTPIQPEGTTQTLNDIDKVFIKIKAGEHFTSTLGDFFLDLNSPVDPGLQYQSRTTLGVSDGREEIFKAFNQSTFDVISRKLIGAEAGAQFEEGSVTIAGASPRGQYTTNTFQGQESYQGPYRLTGKNGERAIIIVAGTEHVYVDGALQTRGERNDYIIDYALGEVVFQSRRLITSESRITIDFQYSDQQYSRSLIAANGKGQLFNSGLQISATYLREGDNEDAPLDLSLSDSDRAILARASNNPSLASKSGVTLAGRNPNGRTLGAYVRADTTINGISTLFYRYDPLDTLNALYNVSFGQAGAGRGSYARVGIGQFQFVGVGFGDYDTLVYLPFPQLHQVVALDGNARITKNFGITGEFATSAFDPNRFASLSSITGNAYRVGALFADTIPTLGYAELRATQRNIGKQFTPIDRIQDVEFERRYGNDAPGLSSSNVQLASSELHREADLRLRPWRALVLEGGYGALEHPELQFSSRRTFARAEVIEDTGLIPRVVVSVERMPTHDSSIHEQAQWDRLSGEVLKTLRLGSNRLTLGVRYGDEKKEATPFAIDNVTSDSLTARSFHYQTVSPFATLTIGQHLTLRGQYDIRKDDSANSGSLARISDSRTAITGLSLIGIGGFSTQIDLTLRDKRYIDSTAFTRNGGDQSTLLLRFEPRYTANGINADALYEISNQRAARLERVFLAVPRELGNYRYLGDLNGNGRPDPDEFALARYSDESNYILVTLPTEQLFPTTGLRSNFHLRVAPGELFGLTKSESSISQVLSNISSESYIRLEETSTDPNPNDIYFFRLSHFRSDSTTISGLLEFGQDFNLLENNAEQSYRLHYLERRSAGQYNTGLEHLFQAERSIRGRFRPSFEFSNETTIGSATDLAVSDTLSVNRPHNTSILSGSTDWSYHPMGSKLDYGTRIELSRSIEHSFDATALADAFTLRSSYALETRARLRAELERDELTLSTAPDVLVLPYALTQGRSVGITWLWRLAIDYQFGSGIVATLSYDGRNEAQSTFGSSGERITIHNARAEVRANF